MEVSLVAEEFKTTCILSLIIVVRPFCAVVFHVLLFASPSTIQTSVEQIRRTSDWLLFNEQDVSSKRTHHLHPHLRIQPRLDQRDQDFNLIALYQSQGLL